MLIMVMGSLDRKWGVWMVAANGPRLLGTSPRSTQGLEPWAGGSISQGDFTFAAGSRRDELAEPVVGPDVYSGAVPHVQS